MADVSNDDLRRKIKEILKGADLSTLSAKKVRIKLQSAFETDLSGRKKEIDQMTMSLILEMEEKKKEKEKDEESEVEEKEEEQNGKKNKSESDSAEEEVKEPPKKKSKSKSKKSHKKEQKDSDVDIEPLEDDDLNIYDEEQKTLKLTDEELAQRLQQFEQTGRRTRNKAAPPKRKPSEKRKGSTNYTRPCELSPSLAEVMGTDRLARHEVMKKMWEIVKERKLQDPKDKRFMICDEQMAKLFGRKRVQLFGMMKYLAPHIYGDNPTIESVITNSDIYDDEADDD